MKNDDKKNSTEVLDDEKGLNRTVTSPDGKKFKFFKLGKDLIEKDEEVKEKD